MKREIKFRIWAKDAGSGLSKKEMVYLHEHTIYDGVDLVFRTDLGIYWIDSSNNGDGEVMQYSGFKDKNGEEIYEGDIVLFKANYTNKRCGWIEGVFMYDENNYYKPGLKVGYDVYEIGEETDEFPYTCEVKGNIYENPNLLV